MSSFLANLKIETITFLKQPYPFYYSGKSLWVIALLISLMSFLFNYFFEPFNVYSPEHKMDFIFISLLHGLNSSLVLILLSIFFRKPSIQENWMVWQEMLLVLLFFFLVGIAQFLIRDIIYDNPNNWSIKYLLEEISNTFLVGFLFLFILIPGNFSRLWNIHSKQAGLLNKIDKDSYINHTLLKIDTPIINERFTLELDHFLFAKADGNYVEIYLKGNPIIKLLKRIPIKELELLLSPYPFVIKTHRSYLVNTKGIKKVSGNAQGYRLEFSDFKEDIPVSRNRIPNFDKTIKRLN
ncbi:MAG: LytTR family DNA-binding domain-containing protein [Eudoraea sp.]|uniref:LytR/AlgR family response regulator transcription factor n=1 Tax=Eudoraea sp. TaxID=1979955 RepID=UPI003C725D42